ncbi:hypothetical protein EDD93_6829 [Streptomyces sp. 840.1]|nr:hypothetical protein EDD93_6829 [Streptomyces sp. 840.1]
MGMDTDCTTREEHAVLVGGPAHGLRLRVTDRPTILQITRPCEVEAAPGGVRAEALYVYRLGLPPGEGPLRYGYDAASP